MPVVPSGPWPVVPVLVPGLLPLRLFQYWTLLFLTGTWPGRGSGSTGSIGTTGPFPGSSDRSAVLCRAVVPPFGPVLPSLRESESNGQILQAPF